MSVHSPSHPVWPIVRMVAVLGSMSFVLWLNADHFDETETRSIVTMFFALLGVEGVGQFVRKKDG